MSDKVMPTTVRLRDNEQKQRLDRLAWYDRVSQSELMRRMIDAEWKKRGKIITDAWNATREDAADVEYQTGGDDDHTPA